ELHWHDPEVSLLEGVLARGGRDIGRVIERAWRDGAVFDAWTEEFSLKRWLDALTAEGIDADALATRPRDPRTPLPWDHISAGVETAYLLAERDGALAGRTTPDCSFDGCTSCGVCPQLGVDISLGGARRG
ncbi:MAG TPA: B12-binding domain-containing radical SAM protein, partial [Coriobacteriia bacterium]